MPIMSARENVKDFFIVSPRCWRGARIFPGCWWDFFELSRVLIFHNYDPFLVNPVRVWGCHWEVQFLDSHQLSRGALLHTGPQASPLPYKQTLKLFLIDKINSNDMGMHGFLQKIVYSQSNFIPFNAVSSFKTPLAFWTLVCNPIATCPLPQDNFDDHFPQCVRVCPSSLSPFCSLKKNHSWTSTSGSRYLDS